MPGATEDESLRSEALLFARHLVGRTPPPEVVERYERAIHRLLASPVSGSDSALLAFVRRHPWSVSFLDAAAGVLRPGSTLRSRILVMAAILETSPAFANEFLPRSTSLGALVAQLGMHGTRAIVRLVVGLLLYPAATRSRP